MLRKDRRLGKARRRKEPGENTMRTSKAALKRSTAMWSRSTRDYSTTMEKMTVTVRAVGAAPMKKANPSD